MAHLCRAFARTRCSGGTPRCSRVETLVHYPTAVYRTGAFADFGPAHLSVSDTLAAEVLSLPIGPHLKSDQVSHVIEAMREAWREAGRSADARRDDHAPILAGRHLTGGC